MTFRFIITPILSFVPIGELYLSNVSWNDPAYGAGASFSGKAEINSSQTREQLQQLTAPDSVALYVRDDETGNYLFGGPLYDNPWLRGERRIQVVAQSWKSWMYQKLLGMNTLTNPVSEKLYSQTAKDQFFIARALISASVNSDLGCPVIALGTELSGVIRDLVVQGSQQRYLGDVIDSMANRDNGFEWNIDIRIGTAGRPMPYFSPSFPMRGGVNNQVILLDQMADGGNIVEMGDPENSAANRRSRVWATGIGQPPDQPVAFDQDPAIISGGFVLLRETVTNYQLPSLTTLTDHARAERIFRNNTLQQVVLSVTLDNPSFRSYATGDKISLIVGDDWIDWNFDAVRIINRTFNVNQEGDGKIDTVQLTIDLNDTELPENTTVV